MMAIMVDSFDRLMVASIMEMKMIDDICQWLIVVLVMVMVIMVVMVMVANIMEMKMIDDICQRCGQAIRAMSRMTGMMRRSRFKSNDHCCDKCEDD